MLTRLLVVAILIAGPMPVTAQQNDPTRALEAFVDGIIKSGFAPGIGLAVVHRGRPVVVAGYGTADVDSGRPVTANTGFYIASATKSFVGLAAALAAREGRLSLETPLVDLLPGMEWHRDIDPAAITLHDLLTHTHGIENNGPLTFRSAYSGADNGAPIERTLVEHGVAESGRAFSYGNVGYNVAGLALAGVLGRSWQDIVHETVLEPLGMTSTTTRRSTASVDLAEPHIPSGDGFRTRHYDKDDANMHAGGGMIMTATDAATWLLANLGDGVVRGRRVFPDGVLTDTHRPRVSQEARFLSYPRTGYGLGWQVGQLDGRVALHHFGSFTGFHSHVSFVPELEAGVAIFTNEGLFGPFAADLISRYAYDLLTGRPDLEAAYEAELEEHAQNVAHGRARLEQAVAQLATRPQRPERGLDAFVGRFRNELVGEISFQRGDGGLVAIMGPIRSSVGFFDPPRQDFLRVELTGSGSVVEFAFDDEGSAIHLTAFGQRFERVPQSYD